MNEFIYNTDTIVNTAAFPQKQHFLGYELCDQNDTALTTQIHDFDFSEDDLNPEDLASRLIATSKFHKVYGIAANQCGLYYRVLVAGANDDWVAFFNPEITWVSDEIILLEETDLSNMALIIPVKRPKSIVIKYQDYNGEFKETKVDGLTARIIQQAVDRLNGIDFKTKVSKLVLQRANTSLNKKVKKFVRTHAIMKKRGKK